MAPGTRRSSAVMESVQRRWRVAVLLGLILLLGLGGFGTVLTLQGVQANRSTAVLKAIRDIRAGRTITSDVIGVSYVRVEDEDVLAGLVQASQRGSVVGRLATQDVPAGGLLPVGLGAAPSDAQLWEVPLPVKRMPPDLKSSDHVAVLVSGTARSGDPIEFVFAQDVRVLSVRSDSVSLWLPASAAAQIEWYADHGGLVVVRMSPGIVQPSLPPGGPTS